MSERKGFHNIVPEREERIGQRNSGTANKAVRDQQPAKHRVASSGGGGWKSLTMMLLLGLAAVSWFGWQQFQQLNTLQNRFDQLSTRLISTDESVSQSGTSLQLKIQEHGDDLIKHWAEIKKLWGISYDINKKQIADNKKISAANKARLTKVEKATSTVASLSQQVEIERKKLHSLSGDALSVSAELEAMQQSLQESTDKLSTLGQEFTRLRTDVSGRLADMEEAVASFNAFRRQVNQELLQLRKELSSGVSANPAPLNQLSSLSTHYFSSDYIVTP